MEVVVVGEAAIAEREPRSDGEVGPACELKEPPVVAAGCTKNNDGPVELLVGAVGAKRRAGGRDIASSLVEYILELRHRNQASVVKLLDYEDLRDIFGKARVASTNTGGGHTGRHQGDNPPGCGPRCWSGGARSR